MEPSICVGCGIVVDRSRSACATCGAAYPSPPLHAAPQPGGGYWVAVRATFTCSACRFDVPLNHFELGDGVVCTRCGVEQRFERSRWRDLVDLAHGVGDLWGDAEGRFPDPEVRLTARPYADVGATTSWAGDETRRVSPGNPLCGACRAPRVVTARSDKTLEVACTRATCGQRARYEAPASVRSHRFAGVLADEHEAGRQEASVVEDGGVVVLRCPNCSAPLSGVKDEDGVTACAYCKVPCRITARTHARAGHKGTPVKTWWLYFEGPSERRRKLTNEARLEAARDAKRAAKRAEVARSAHAVQVPAGGARGERPPSRASTVLLAPLVVVALVLVAGAVWWVQRPTAPADDPALANLPGDDALARYSFSMSDADTKALFGPEAKPGATVKLRPGGRFDKVKLGGAGGPTYSLDLFASSSADAAGIIERLGGIAPNRMVENAAKQREISVGKALVRVDPRPTPMYGARIEIMTWLEGERGVRAANAMLAAVKFAALDGAKPSDEELCLVNGTPLAAAARLDTSAAIEAAAAMFVATFPSGDCKSVHDILASRTELVCESEVDHALVKSVRYAWPNAAGARLQRVVFVLDRKRGEADVGPCVDAALGEGTRKVVDHATGAAARTWRVGKRGDSASLHDTGLELRVRDGAKPGDAADFAGHHPKIVESLSACAGGGKTKAL